jgi:hypothetical protein
MWIPAEGELTRTIVEYGRFCFPIIFLWCYCSRFFLYKPEGFLIYDASRSERNHFYESRRWTIYHPYLAYPSTPETLQLPDERFPAKWIFYNLGHCRSNLLLKVRMHMTN